MVHRLTKNLSRTQMIALGFLLIILTGTFLLMTPFASKSGRPTDFLSALFTATSATCVTGLTVVNTFFHWSVFGQIVIICLIQIGGLGFISFGFFFSILLRQRISLNQRGLLKESLNVENISGMVKLSKVILKGTLLIEGTGALILTVNFLPYMKLSTAVYNGIFHSISAFCNAGFDLFARFGSSSVVNYNDNWGICFTLGMLILIGGIGFFVWYDIYLHKWHVRKYALHTKIVLMATLVITVVSMILFLIMEKDHTFVGMTGPQKILNAFFCSTTPRTAGFNSIDIEAMSTDGKFLTILLMFIGGAPGSTAGGIKLTTLVVLIVYLCSILRRDANTHVFHRRIETNSVLQSTAVVFTNLSLSGLAILIICMVQNTDLTKVMFEVVSAISTVGMTDGFTASLATVSRVVIIFLMYLGRLGSLSFALSFTDKKKKIKITYPIENVNVG